MMPTSATETMKAWVLHGEKDIRLEERATPKPAAGEVLVGVRAAGICGSDLHYHAHGRCGNFIPTRPFILGHEFAGEIVAVGEGVDASRIGERVAVDPSRPCGSAVCAGPGRYNLCPEMVYFGSASVVPPSEGCFAEYVDRPGRAMRWPIARRILNTPWGALLEPLSVAMHAVQRSGGVAGKMRADHRWRHHRPNDSALRQCLRRQPSGGFRLRTFRPTFAIEQGATGTLDPADPTAPQQAELHAAGWFRSVSRRRASAPRWTRRCGLAAKGATVVQVGTFPTAPRSRPTAADP